MTIASVEGNSEQIEAVRELWSEYWESLGFTPEFQSFADELKGLPGKYQPPAGCLLLLYIGGVTAGTAALRPLHGTACEIKRLFVRPASRGRGAARRLMEALIDEARRIGYTTMFADTLPDMAAALRLYRDLGFEEVEPYSDAPTPDAVYLRLKLEQSHPH